MSSVRFKSAGKLYLLFCFIVKSCFLNNSDHFFQKYFYGQFFSISVLPYQPATYNSCDGLNSKCIIL